MGNDALVTRATSQIIEADHINLFNRVLIADFVGRNASGSPTAGQNLGTAITPWGTAYITELILNGQVISAEGLAAELNRVVSGKVRATSNFPDYLRPNGASAQFTLLATATNLKVNINGAEVVFTSDIVKSGLVTAPTVNNVCLVNDIELTGQNTTKNLGENKTIIAVDSMGSELTAKIGQIVALLNQSTGEIMYIRIDSATQLSNASRGFFFNSLGNPVERAVLNNNDVLQLLSLGFIFAENDAATIDVTYRNPVIGGNEPSSPQVGDYWLDLDIIAWKRYNGSIFTQINRTFVGYAVIDTANCVATRPEDFGSFYSGYNSLKVTLLTGSIVQSEKTNFITSVDGRDRKFNFGFLQWDAATDFESGVSRTADTNYWLYITEEGKPIISDKKPYDRLGFFKGWYHPYESWRSVAQIYNNASNNFEIINSSDATIELLDGPIVGKKRIILTNNGATDIDFSSGKFTFDDNRGEAVAPAYTKDLSSSWSPGNNGGSLDTGSSTTNAWYYCYAIHNNAEGLSDYLNTLTFGSPTLPTGYSSKRYIGSIRTGASAIVGFTQINKRFIWSTRQILAVAGPSTLPVGPTARTIFVPPGPAVISHIGISDNIPGSFYAYFTSPLEADIPPGTAAKNYGLFGGKEFRIMTNTGQIRERWSSAVTVSAGEFFYIATVGWNDLDLED